ncbi:reverse transcriptase domain-containing protein, partial [Tanacetum coccineum]
IPIDPKDQEKTTFTCPYGTFAYRRMPFGLCNAPGTFQRCMMAILYDIIEKTMEVFMDDFSVFGDSFSACLSNLDKMLKRCEDTNLVLNWEKSHFMVKEGIVLGHKISKSGIEVDRAKVDVIAKLPHPTTARFRMERAATTASSLEAEQDSGSGPRCQDTTLGGVEAQIRFEIASKQSNDPPLSRVNTLGSRDDSIKLKELMDLCTKLLEKVLDLG